MFVLLAFIFTVLLPWLAIFFNNRGFAKYENNQIQSAIQDYELALILKPDYVPALYNQGLAYEKLQDFNNASANYEYAILKNKNFAPAYNNLARLYITQRKDYLTAVKLLNQALQIPVKNNLDVEDLSAYKNVEYVIFKNLGWAYFELKRYSEAKKALNQAINLDNQRGSAYCLLAQVLEASNQKNKSKAEWEKCLQFADPNHPDDKEWLKLAKQRLKY
ncbi:tetratricopeptide repeat protein [Fischerella sp. JS2]|uniref:tetratricopeptide repeat protein n=1 Tax=Fischerella sp. JS2 TaxID=2597771 RepID=UPI003CCC9A52